MCLYCYATSYIGLRRSAPKRNFIKNLVHDLLRTSPQVPINIGTSSDPYPPEEEKFRLTRRTLEVLTTFGRRVLITTKGAFIKDDVDILRKGNFAVTPTITTLDDRLAKVIEPGAPSPTERLEAIRRLISDGVPVGVRVDPIIPYVNDDEKEIETLVEKLVELGVRFIVTSTYKAKPDNLARMRKGLGEIGERIYRLYKDKGVKLYGYTYLPKELRERLLHPVIKTAKRYGIEYATCREGLTGRRWFNAKTCDGTHLIPSRIKPKVKVSEIDRWLDNRS